VIQADAGNSMAIDIGNDAELFAAGLIVADGGTIQIEAAPSAIAGGLGIPSTVELTSARPARTSPDPVPCSSRGQGHCFPSPRGMVCLLDWAARGRSSPAAAARSSWRAA